MSASRPAAVVTFAEAGSCNRRHPKSNTTKRVRRLTGIIEEDLVNAVDRDDSIGVVVRQEISDEYEENDNVLNHKKRMDDLMMQVTPSAPHKALVEVFVWTLEHVAYILLIEVSVLPEVLSCRYANHWSTVRTSAIIKASDLHQCMDLEQVETSSQFYRQCYILFLAYYEMNTSDFLEQWMKQLSPQWKFIAASKHIGSGEVFYSHNPHALQHVYIHEVV